MDDDSPGRHTLAHGVIHPASSRWDHLPAKMNVAKGALTLLLFAAEQSKSAAFGIRKTTTQQCAKQRRSFGSRSSGPSALSTASWLTNGHYRNHIDRSNLYRFRGGGPSSALSSTATPTTEMETDKKPVEIFRKDYQPPPFTISTVNLDFNINPGKTIVTSKLTLIRNPLVADDSLPLVLDGDETSVKLRHIKLHGKELLPDMDYKLEPGKLTILTKSPLFDSNNQIVLEMESELVPEDNTQLSGLYYSDPMYCTQCEAQGFRRITYYLDRPDVMAVFERVRLEANAEAYPVLLSNGNLLEQGQVDGESNRHYAVWSDPFPKPR